jgi:hypothetical protein
MPEPVKSVVGSLRGTIGADGITECPFFSKYAKNADRMLAEVICVFIRNSIK